AAADVVDVDDAAVDPLGEGEASHEVAGVHRVDQGGEGIGQRECFLLGVHHGDRRDRAEDLLGEHGHVGFHLGQHRRAVEQAVVPGAFDHLSTHAHRRLDQLPVQAVELGGADHRAEVDVAGGRVANAQRTGARGQCGGVVGGDSTLDDVPAGGDAGLPLEVERGRAAGDRRVEVGVVQYDECVVTAQFQARAPEIAGGDGSHAVADLDRAGEVDHRHVRVFGQRLA